MRRISLTILLLCLFACADNQPSDKAQSHIDPPRQKEAESAASANPGDSRPKSISRAVPQSSTSPKRVEEPVVAPWSSDDSATRISRNQPDDLKVSHANAATTTNRGLNRPSMNQPGEGVPLGLLPSGVVPLSYALELTVDPTEDRFSGRADITTSVEVSTRSLFIHGKDLDVGKVAALLPSGEQVTATYNQVHDDGIARIEFERSLEPGEVVLTFEYSANFGRLLHGLYKVEAGGNSYAFTQMESVYARQAFPSFDEPAFKTPFELTLIVPEAHEAIANMPQIESESLPDGFKRLRFAPSPPMTTYLFAIAVGPLDIVDAGTLPANDVRKTPLPFRGVAIAGKGGDLDYAIKETGAILTALERYFDQPYPYAKLDIIAVPDFDAGAMENIGAITFREKLLLLKEDAPPQQKRAYASVMAHELAHMWFGNLVTMPWWDDIWLNESFATWMSYKAVQSYDPEHQPFVSQLRRTAYAMKQDGLISARQIREPVADNDDIVAAFDGITYSKGGAVLSMFEKFVGEDKFRQGIREHMVRYAHGSATVYDLIDSLSRVSGRDLAPAAESFLFQSGVPLVTAEIDCERSRLELTQTRFLPLGSEGDPARKWIIPVCYKLGNKRLSDEATNGASARVQEQCLLMSEHEESVPIEGECPDWLLPNAEFAGYFHWLVPEAQYATLLQAQHQLSEFELLSIADSVRAGFANGKLSVDQTWTIIEQLAQSSYPSVARSMVDTVEFISRQLIDSAAQRWALRGRSSALFQKMEAYRAFDADFLLQLDDNQARIHYSDVASFMAEVAYDSETRRAALVKARQFLSDEQPMDTVSRATLDTILTVAVQDGGQALVDKLLAKLHDSDDAWFRDIALSALARSRDAEFGQELRLLALSDRLRSNEIRRLLLSHLQEDVNTLPTWEWLKRHFDELAVRMPARHVGSLAQVAVHLCDERYADEINDVMRPVLRTLPGGERKLDNALESMQVCAATSQQHGPSAVAYFGADGDLNPTR